MTALIFELPCPDISAWRAGNTGVEGVWHFDSGLPGRHVMVSALVHGNELCGAWALCGITHTTSTHAVMQGFFDLRAAPVQPWDAVICTSRSVHASVSYQMDLIDEHLRAHLRAVPPPRPMLPVIPLGIHAADFEPDAAAGAALRARLGAGPNDVVFTTIARLTPHEKFDPLPIYLARIGSSR